MREWFVAVVVVVAVAGPVAGAGGGNEPPLADAGLDQEVEAGQVVMLDGTGSRDPDGSIVDYEWTVVAPDGSEVTPECSDCPRTQFDAGQVGRYEATVRVTDDEEAVRSDALYVDVESSTSPPPDDGEAGPSTPDDEASDGTSESARGDGGSPPSLAGSAGAAPDSRCESETAGDECHSDLALGPMVIIDGPGQVPVDQAASFGTRTGGFSDGAKTYSWSPDDRGASTSTSWRSTGTKTVFVSVTGPDDRTATASKTVDVVENEPPVVRMDDPSSVDPGESLTLSLAEKRDPDGEIVDTTWENGPTVTVPTDGSDVTVRVTVTDDEDKTATDSITVSGREDHREVTNEIVCFLSNAGPMGQRATCYDGGKGGEMIDAGSGSAALNEALPEDFDEEKLVIQRQPDEEYQHGAKAMPKFPTREERDPYLRSTYQNPESAHSVENLGSESAVTTQSFTLDGRAVENDLNGDGDVDATDWDERYGSSEDSEMERHQEAVETIRGQQRSIHKSQTAVSSSDSDKSAVANDSETTSDSNQPEDDSGTQSSFNSWADKYNSTSESGASKSEDSNSTVDKNERKIAQLDY